MRLIYCMALSIWHLTALAQASYPFGTIWKRVYDDEVIQASSNDNKAKEFLRTIRNDGSWPGIDYTSRAITDWNPSVHFERLTPMISAYIYERSALYQHPGLFKGIIKALQYWSDHDFESDNWWHNEIAVPKAIGVSLVLMKFGKEKIPEDLEFSLVFKMIKGDPYAKTGANKSDIAMHYFYRALITQDKDLLASSLEQLFYPVQLVDGKEGLQYDYSYLQHGPQLYIGGYGEEFLKGISKIIAYVRDTPYAIAPERKDLFIRFLAGTYLPIIRAGYIDFNVHGRGVSRPNILKKKGETNILQQMLLIDPQNKASWEKGIARLDSTVKYNTEIPATHTHYWKGDYTTHLRTGYHFNVRIASTRTNRSEAGNQENIYGKFMTDGVTNIQVSGPEYYNIMPVWEWDKIPGTTARDYAEDQVLVEQWGAPANNIFAGGVSDGTYGATAMILDYDSVKANKSWFFFEKQVVCLGAGISSLANEHVTTTINQTWWKEKVLFNTKAISKDDSLSLSGNAGDIISHNQVLYYFPASSDLKLTTKKQRGTWHKINRARPKNELTGHVFKLWFDHGTKPTNATYEYIVYPATDKLDNKEVAQVKILQNTAEVQAAQHTGLGLTQVVFYRPATLETDRFTLKVDQPILLQVKQVAQGFEIHAADPNQNASTINLDFMEKESNINKQLVIKLPQNEHRGSTVMTIVSK